MVTYPLLMRSPITRDIELHSVDLEKIRLWVVERTGLDDLVWVEYVAFLQLDEGELRSVVVGPILECRDRDLLFESLANELSGLVEGMAGIEV